MDAGAGEQQVAHFAVLDRQQAVGLADTGLGHVLSRSIVPLATSLP
ncbi:hypothetical protein [Reyranella sp.]|jgi:hypothetical protein